MTEPSLLNPEESSRIDTALMTSRDKFATRVAVYALRMLQQLNENDRLQPSAQPNFPLSTIEIRQWLQGSEVSKALILEQGLEWDDQFLAFWTQLIDSAQRSLMTIATDLQIPLESLTIEQVVCWFETKAIHN